jgi:hypothetical protein
MGRCFGSRLTISSLTASFPVLSFRTGFARSASYGATTENYNYSATLHRTTCVTTTTTLSYTTQVYLCNYRCPIGRSPSADHTQIPRSHSLASFLPHSFLHAASVTPSFPFIHHLLDGTRSGQPAAPLTESLYPLYTPL